MAQHSPTIAFEDVPLDEARRMSRAPRMAPELYDALRQKLQSLQTTAARLTIPDGTSLSTMKHRILRCLEISTCYPHCISSADEHLMAWG